MNDATHAARHHVSTESAYAAAYAAWKSEPQAFWADAARAIDWFRPADQVFDAPQAPYTRELISASLDLAARRTVSSR